MDLLEFEGVKLGVNTFADALTSYITPGDILCLEVDTMRFGKLLPGISRECFLGGFFELFKRLVGPNGTVVIPTFSYSWGQTSSVKVYDVLNTPGKVGIFPEFFRKQPGVLRTMDPMFSLAIWGKKSEELISGITKTSFGQGSVYHRMHDHNAKLISFGLNKYDPTFIHYAEQYYHENVRTLDYRFVKRFEGEIIDVKGRRYEDEHYCFSRHLDRYGDWKFYDKDLRVDLRDQDKLQEIIIGNSTVRIADARSVFNVAQAGLERDMHYLIRKEGYQVCTDTI